jgi:hypothetical protein
MSRAIIPEVPFVLTVRARCKLCAWENEFALNAHYEAAKDAAKHFNDEHPVAAKAVVEEWKV